MTQSKISIRLKGKLNQSKDRGKFYYSLMPVIKEELTGGLTDADRQEIVNSVQKSLKKR